MRLSKDQIAALEARFGAAAALAAVKDDADYTEALEQGAEAQARTIAENAAAIQEKDAEIAALKGKVSDLEAKVQTATNGLKDPLAKDDPPAPPAEDAEDSDENDEPLPIAQAYEALVATGKTPAEAWAELRKTRPEDYAAHFAMD